MKEECHEKLKMMKDLYIEWNDKINVISRKDIDQFEINHALHSLSIAKVFSFKAGTEILDFGTGGGFPGIPLAIFYPEVRFTLVDSIGKKMKVVEAISKELNLDNVEVVNDRVENIHRKFDFITCRAVGRIGKIMPWVRNYVKAESNNSKPNGFIFLKGGDLDEELKETKLNYQRIKIANLYDEDFFETKEIIYLSKYIK